MTTWNQTFKSVCDLPRWPIVATGVVVFGCGLVWPTAALLGLGATVVCLVLHRLFLATFDADLDRLQINRRKRDGVTEWRSVKERTDEAAPVQAPLQRVGPPKTTDALVDELLAYGRYALLLRPETKQHLTQAQVMRAIRQLDEAMALVPEGRVLVGQLAEQSNSACGPTDIDPKLAKRNLVSVQPVYLDRYCVTNAEYQRFVDEGGYEQLEYWHEEALPALLDFVDQSGTPGPRFWSEGQYPTDEQRLPVVGVSWYEAWAYARWVGKRLPSDAEWTKAAAWPVESAPGRIAQRRYPWGESFDLRRAHLYGSGFHATVPVDEFPGGTSVGGIHQLIGNVWEWTSTPLAEVADRTLHVSEAMMSIRGGAFDTYFENQATSHFQSADHALARRRNIGVRLALPMSDLETPHDTDSQTDSTNEQEHQESTDDLVLAVQ